MSNVTSEYHRTFKALRPQSMREMMSQASLNRRMRELEEEYKKNKGFGKNNASTSAVSRPTYEAFEYIGEQLSSVLIETKEDQRFGAFATPWEVAWSRLTSFQDRRFFPVVDSNGTVIGHIGEVSSDNLLIANETWTYQHQFPHKDALKYYRMFVGPKALHGRSDLEKYAAASPFQNYSVLSTIDGEVMAFSLKNFNTERSLQSVSLLEIAGWISVAGLGGKILLSLGARGFRTLMRRGALKDIKVFMDKSQKNLGNLNKQRRISAGSLHPRVKGKAEVSNEFGATEREIHSANRFAKKPEWDEVHLGDEARAFYNAPKAKGPFPDVVARKKMPDGSVTIALSEGKGLGGLKKSIQQFEAAGPKIMAAENARAGGKPVRVTFSEQEVVVEKVVPFEVEGGTLISPGRGYGIDKDGFLLDATGYVDLKVGMPQRVIVNGKPIKVITMEYYGGPIHLQQ